MKGLSYACLCAVVVLGCGAACAQRITVDFAGIPIDDALAEVERQSGYRIIHYFRGLDTPPVVDLKMEDAPLRAVLRAICQQVDCYLYRSSKGYIYVREGLEPAAGCPAVPVGPYTVRLRSVRITDTMTLSFEHGAEAPLSFLDSMSLTITVEADEDADVAAIAALDPQVKVVDSAGNTVAPRYQKPLRSTSQGLLRTYWGRVQAYIATDAPSPAALSLRTVEGDIIVHTDVQQLRFEFPLEGEGAQAQGEAGHTVTVTDVGLGGQRDLEVVAEWRFAAPASEDRSEYWRRPLHAGYVVSAQGLPLAPLDSDISARRENDQLVYTCTFQFRPRGEVVPEKFVFELLIPSDETETLHYKFEDIPLPRREEAAP